MSPSPEGYLVYGFHLGSCDDYPEALRWIFAPDEDAEHYDDDEARIYTAYKGPDDPDEPSGDWPDLQVPGAPFGHDREATPEEADLIKRKRAWLDARLRVVKAAGIAILGHGYQCDNSTLYVTNSKLAVEWGDVADAGAHMNANSGWKLYWRDQVRDFCGRLDVPFEEPRWLLLTGYA